mmetsp:Transcript_78381/g.143459  ORF Transcript_78381/g.143459 Transcript_78381/m.143459 type:complete len:665 (-) Transcript_78381:28-2022(-)
MPPRRLALAVPKKEEEEEDSDAEEVGHFRPNGSDADSVSEEEEKEIKLSERLSVSAKASKLSKARRPTAIFTLKRPDVPATWAYNVADNLLTPEDQFDAAVKLADASAAGNGDSIDRLLQVVEDDSQTVFARCASASALAAAALTKNVSMFDWNAVEADQNVFSSSAACDKPRDAQVRPTVFDIVGRPMAMPSRVTGIQYNRRTVAGRHRSPTQHQDLILALKSGVGMESLTPSTRQVAGDENVLEVMKNATSDPNLDVRLTAVQTLGHVVTKPTKPTRKLLAKVARDKDSCVRVAAVTALAHLAGSVRLQAEALEADTPLGKLRQQALRTAAKKGEEMGEEDDEEDLDEMFEELLEMLIKFIGKEHDPDVRLAAALGTAEVAPRGREDVVDALLKLLGEEDEFENASDGSSESEDHGASSDEDNGAFQTALKAIHARKSHVGLLFGKAARLQYVEEGKTEDSWKQKPVERFAQNTQLRAAAATALSSTCKIGDSKVARAVAYAIEDEDGQVRAAALGSLVAIAVKRPTDKMSSAGQALAISMAVRAALKHAFDKEAAVRQVAVAHLGKLLPRRDEEMPTDNHRKAVAVLLKCLEDHEASVRRMAANSLAEVAKKSDRLVLKALSRNLQDADWAARRAAMDSLQVLTVNEKDRQLLQTLKKCYA